MIIINASLKDTIDSIIYYKKPIDIDPIKVIEVDNNSNKEEISKLFKECLEFTILDQEIEFKIKKTEEEIKEEIRTKTIGNENSIKYWITYLKNISKKHAVYKQQILDYCREYKINWLIEEIKDI